MNGTTERSTGYASRVRKTMILLAVAIAMQVAGSTLAENGATQQPQEQAAEQPQEQTTDPQEQTTSESHGAPGRRPEGQYSTLDEAVAAGVVDAEVADDVRKNGTAEAIVVVRQDDVIQEAVASPARGRIGTNSGSIRCGRGSRSARTGSGPTRTSILIEDYENLPTMFVRTSEQGSAPAGEQRGRRRGPRQSRAHRRRYGSRVVGSGSASRPPPPPVTRERGRMSACSTRASTTRSPTSVRALGTSRRQHAAQVPTSSRRTTARSTTTGTGRTSLASSPGSRRGPRSSVSTCSRARARRSRR